MIATPIMTEEDIKYHTEVINSMSHMGMAAMWRNAPIGHIYFRGDLPLYEIFSTRFKALGGWTPEISKAVGWD